MAFVRTFMAYGGDPDRMLAGYAGSPGWFRKLRKLAVGRAIGKVARAAAPLAAFAVPGIGAVAGGLATRFAPRLARGVTAFARRAQPMVEQVYQPEPQPEPNYYGPPDNEQTSPAEYAQSYPDQVDDSQLSDEQGYPSEVDQAYEILRSYGLVAGDPRPLPVPHGAKTMAKGRHTKGTRKMASRGPGGKFTGSSARGKQGGSFGESHPGLVGLGKAALGGIPFVGGLASEGFGQLAASGGAHPGAMGGFGKRRRRINPTNVHALRRSLTRVAGFQKLAHRVEKHFAKISKTAMRHPHAYGSAPAARARRHGAGCRCATCKG